ncbi:MAG: FkbM family methyltransferase [Vicinamibacterales bacterium]|nr:FkbM family methyltransferase [Vicinamibacterales bacterium]
MRRWLQARLSRAGWSVHRWPSHRFDGMGDVLEMLRRQGYRPSTVVDIGANVGQWTDLAAGLFHAAEHHLIEPQPALHATLARFQPPRFHVHPVALTSAGVSEASMSGSGTGMHVVTAGSAPSTRVPASSLDALLADRLTQEQRTLIKIDVESHELTVLGGGTRVMAAAEVIISEYHYYDIEQTGTPVFRDLLDFMARHGYDLYDISAVHGRARDLRAQTGDAVFVRRDSPLTADTRWA